jgi:hypothetical protein
MSIKELKETIVKELFEGKEDSTVLAIGVHSLIDHQFGRNTLICSDTRAIEFANKLKVVADKIIAKTNQKTYTS